MPIPEHLIHTQTFEGGMNSDLADEYMRKNMARVFLNCRVLSSAGGNIGVVSNMLGNVLVTTPLPDGINKTIGSTADEKRNKIYFAVYNSDGYHTWYQYDELLNKVIRVLQSKTDSDGIDILRFNLKYPIFHIDIIDGTDTLTGTDSPLLSWCDAYNKGRKFNINKALDKSPLGYGYTIFEDYINQYKKCPVYAPVPNYLTDPSRNSNFLYGKLFKFCYRYIYDDGEISNYSDWSTVALPENQSYQGLNSITNDNNCIALHISTGSPIVDKIEIAMLTQVDTISTLKWATIAILNKAELNIADNTNYIYNFFNDGAYTIADQDKINRPYIFMFRVPTCQAFVKVAMTQVGGVEGFPSVQVSVAVAMQYKDLFLPPGTVNQLNSPSITITQTSYTTETAFVKIDRYNPTNRFVIGNDVKAGNVFTVHGSNGGFDILGHHIGDNYNWSVTATLSDTAISIANKIKAFLRSTNRGLPDGHNGISGESVDGSGNAIFSYSYLGQWKQDITKFTGTVTPVEYVTLKDNGVSVRVIKSGSIRQYALGYEDDDGRKSPAYTNDQCVIRTPFLTEAPGGIIQQPIHEVSISHRPPEWARYWVLYRTPDETAFIQLLVQQVIDVVVISAADPGEYLDLVIGSLFTYQKIHPDVILSYQFERGDRLRLIRNENTGSFYTPYFETEILSYSEVTTELVNAQITVYGTDIVTPADGPRADYVGKNIQIAGYERTIIGISGGDYTLDGVINIGPSVVTAIEANYTFIDRRGIARISKPKGYSVVNFSTVELYKPVKNTDNLDYKIFSDTAQKFDISDFGAPTRAHRGSHQDQDGTDDTTIVSTPAIVLVQEGDAYIRSREMPTNNSIINTEVLVDNVEDPNFSDFFASTLNNLGRSYPKDDGRGQKKFGSRVRFSNNYIADTAINGLNDYNNLDREDYNDAYSDIVLTKFRGNRLWLFKRLKDCYVQVGQSIITTPDGQKIIGLSDKLLGPIQYMESYDGGIGDHPESWGTNDTYMYHSVNDGFVRIAGDGVDLVSKEFGYDHQARSIMAQVKKYNLRIPFGHDKQNGNVLWSMPQYIAPVYDNPIVEADWDVTDENVPGGSTVIIVTQPANGTVTYDAPSGNFLINMDTDFVGSDTFTYKFQYPDTTFSPIKNGCITSTEPPARETGYRVMSSSIHCRTLGGDNDGQQQWYELEGYYLSDGTLTGFIMPNIAQISPDAIVADTVTITYHQDGDVAPTGGANGDIWYNEPSDVLYKKIAGVWTVLTNRVLNNYYVSPIVNLTDCPIPPPPVPTLHFNVRANYGLTIVDVLDGSTTGIPAGYTGANISTSLRLAYVTVTNGTIQVKISGSIVLPGHLRLYLSVSGVSVGTVNLIIGQVNYTLVLPVTQNSPTEMEIGVESF